MALVSSAISEAWMLIGKFSVFPPKVARSNPVLDTTYIHFGKVLYSNRSLNATVTHSLRALACRATFLQLRRVCPCCTVWINFCVDCGLVSLRYVQNQLIIIDRFFFSVTENVFVYRASEFYRRGLPSLYATLMLLKCYSFRLSK